MKKIQNIESRYFKFKYSNGWRTKFFDKDSKLLRYIKENKNILDSYVSLNDYYDVKNIDKSKYPRVKHYRSCIDLDDITKENAKKVLSLLKENNLKYDYILQTSKNSLQIVLDGNKDKLLKKLMEKNKIDFCPTTLNDKKRVIRLFHSIHHSKLKTKFLDEDLKGFKGIPLSKIKEEKQKHTFFYKFLRQRVNGIKKNDRSVLYYKSDLLNLSKINYLQRRFNLSDCYILFYPKERQKYGYLFPKAIQNSQLKKIQKSNNFIRISKKRNGKLILAPEPKLFKIVPYESKGYWSLPHMNFLRSLGVNKKYDIEIGKEDSGSIGRWIG